MDERHYQLREDLAWREFEDRLLVVDSGNGQFHSLTEVGGFIWRQLHEGNNTHSGIVSALLVEFEVEADLARSDADAFLQRLVDVGLVRVE